MRARERESRERRERERERYEEREKIIRVRHIKEHINGVLGLNLQFAWGP